MHRLCSLGSAEVGKATTFYVPPPPPAPPGSMLDKTKVFVRLIVLILSKLIEE